MGSKTHSGFSLLELIVVVLIVSLIGFLVFSEAIKQQQKVEVLDPTTLPKTFRKSFAKMGDIELFCIKKCKECYVAQDGQVTTYDGGIKFGENVEIYKLDRDNQLVQIDEWGRYKDEKISLRYTLYANGSTSKMIISNDSGIYYLPTYFGEATKVSDLEEAKALWINEQYDLRDSGSYY